MRKIKTPNRTCAWCAADFYQQSSKKNNAKATGLSFCTRKCKDIAQRIGGLEAIQPDHYGTGTSERTYRALAFRTYAAKCIDCGYDKHRDVLEVHHLNGDRTQAPKENLVIVCPTCHVERHAGHRPNTNYQGEIIPLKGVEIKVELNGLEPFTYRMLV